MFQTTNQMISVKHAKNDDVSLPVILLSTKGTTATQKPSRPCLENKEHHPKPLDPITARIRRCFKRHIHAYLPEEGTNATCRSYTRLYK